MNFASFSLISFCCCCSRIQSRSYIPCIYEVSLVSSLENIKEHTKILRLISEFNKVIKIFLKINFIYILVIKYLKIKLKKKQFHLQYQEERIKYLEIQQKVQNLNTENYKTLLRKQYGNLEPKKNYIMLLDQKTQVLTVIDP